MRTRITARTYRTADGEIINEYTVDGVAFDSLEAVAALTEVR